MATILLVEDQPDLGLYEARLLAGFGHRIVRCGGAPAPLGSCPMLRYGSCPLPDNADLILFSSALYLSSRNRTYRGIDLLKAYREHPVYGGIPMLVVAVGAPHDLPGMAPVEVVEKFSSPEIIVAAAQHLLSALSESRAPSRTGC